MENKRRMTIHFMDGTEMKFDFPEQSADTTNLGTAIREVLKEDQFVLEVEGVMYIFPYSNVKYIRVSPPPKKLPSTVIRGVRLLDF